MIINSKTHIFMIVFSLLLLAISFGVDQAIAEPPQPEKKMEIKWGKPTAGVVCAVTLRQKSIEHHVDQPIKINLHTKNTGSKTFRYFHFNSVLKMYTFHVLDPNGKPISLTFHGNSRNSPVAGVLSYYLTKGGTDDYPGIWLNRYFDMTLPGIYQVSFKQKMSYLDNKKSVAVTVTSNTLQIKVIEPSKSDQESKPEASEVKWGKTVEKIACAVSTNVPKNTFYFKAPIWVNLHTKKSSRLNGLAGEYEISVMTPYEVSGQHLSDTLGGKLEPIPLTLYGLKQTKGKDKSTLHITLKPEAKEDFVRLHLSRYFDMTLFSTKYKVSFKRKLKLPKQKKTITVQSNTLPISNRGNTKPKK